jgi:hypothetical protein
VKEEERKRERIRKELLGLEQLHWTATATATATAGAHSGAPKTERETQFASGRPVHEKERRRTKDSSRQPRFGGHSHAFPPLTIEAKSRSAAASLAPAGDIDFKSNRAKAEYSVNSQKCLPCRGRVRAEPCTSQPCPPAPCAVLRGTRRYS